MKKIKVLIVDDSALIRQTLSKLITSDPHIEVAGTASDPYIAAKKIEKVAPDVMTLDVEMPRMDGLTFLKKIMSQRPMPVVIISSLTSEGTEAAFKALEYGAVDVIAKPQQNILEFFDEEKIRICDVIKSAAAAKTKRKTHFIKPAEPKLSVDSVLLKTGKKNLVKTSEKVIAIGASTGGTEAIRETLEAMPADSPGIVIVQHMPELFTRSFANRLDKLCAISVKEAEDGDAVIRGRALIAPGNKHTLLCRSGARYFVKVEEGPLVNRHRPSVDVLFRSAAQHAGPNAIGVLLTGMGADGARGLLEMKEAGASTIAQDEASCVVFGMPKEAIRLNAVDKIVSLDQIAAQILRFASQP